MMGIGINVEYGGVYSLSYDSWDKSNFINKKIEVGGIFFLEGDHLRFPISLFKSLLWILTIRIVRRGSP